MSGKFSATLRLGDLNDFIAPSQSCIVSLKGLKAHRKSKPEESQDKLPKIPSTPSVEPVKVTLHDCLACSGCLTSAETVMLEQQSVNEFLSHISGGYHVIVSVSSQSRASLAAYSGLTPIQVLKKITSFLKSLGVKAVFDISCSRDLSLVEACNEFVTRYQEQSGLPVLASACPGWICYAEKTLGSYILPYISTVKSPQQTMGAVIKHHVSKKMGFMPEKIYHVTIMPCYDKKLEAARDDFIYAAERQGETGKETAGPRISEVDCVLTTGELLDLLKMKNIDMKSLEEAAVDRLLTNIDDKGRLYGVRGGSGGYAESIFVYAAKQLFGKDIKGPLDFKILRNTDFREISLEVNGSPVLKFALCYGFRNLQNIVRKIKAGKCEYHYVEVMACPAGCLNGGGQIKPAEGQSVKELLQLLEKSYLDEVSISDPFENSIIKHLYNEWLLMPGSELAKRFIHTEYHHRERSINSELNNW
eukprot:TRINITY_DN1424_c0_g1_i1.p1 TRINITY_DN1424_c0_g1~~TRINITY_DN1424_c0_g1_i1.p1  ORF type:complete len:474 (-),score=76.94 TRINITY_DN1424_c0_g1_i1:450-1871(-)